MFISPTNRHLTLLAYASGGLLAAIIVGLVLLLWIMPGESAPAPLPPVQSDLAILSLPPVVATTTLLLPPPIEKHMYIQVVSGCGPSFAGTCVNARSGPGTEYASVKALRIGMVLETSGSIVRDGERWYRIIFDEWLRYPERVRSPMYVSAKYVQLYVLNEAQQVPPGFKPATTTKYILVDKSDQTLYAYDGDVLFMKLKISTGLKDTPTPLGHFSVYRKTPTRYMQGPIPGISSQSYDLPGVPWNLYFTAQGAVIHGAYWHSNFGRPWSHGCVNLPVDQARALYQWADLGTPVIVRA